MADSQEKSSYKLHYIAGIFQNSVIAAIFTLFNNKEWRDFLETSVLRYFLFPFATFADLLRTLYTSYELYNASNKNLAKWGNFLLDTCRTILVTTAMIGSIVAVSQFLYASPILYLCTFAVGALYNFGAAIANLILWRRGGPNSEIYKENAKQFAIAGLKELLFGAIMLGLMLTPVGPALALAIGFIATIGAIVGTLQAIYHKLKGERLKSEPTKLHHEDSEVEMGLDRSHSVELTPIVQNAGVPVAPAIKSFDYYQRKNREQHVANLRTLEEKKHYLETEINNKIAELVTKLQPGKPTVWNRLKHEGPKLRQKITFLTLLLSYLTPNPFTEQGFNTSICEAARKGKHGKVLQSTFRNMGDVEDILRAVEELHNPGKYTASVEKAAAVTPTLCC